MSNDDFTTAARAEAEQYGYENAPTIGTTALVARAHLHGWEAARTYLAEQEPTDAEVEAAAEALWKRHSDPLERKVYPFSAAPSRMRFIVDARAALSAARAAHVTR